ncbi:MAG TPA: zf-HC2 domain-containing protein [Candidatus Corynebacterium avicola]|uniref:Zf-HC2 domain-containing protein n=1 Tax=Candidatus Corynebacterium avicola TaxID=2838527 RepID=A0A9D1RNH5_9CORY|nr:zf-HC2 domain-containing protein [Candidatus Corynebacterium avicola]
MTSGDSTDIHQQVRAALSARLDGEPGPAGLGDDAVDAHLDACDKCQQWFVDASDLNRRLRMSVAPETPSAPVDPGALAEHMAQIADDTPRLSHRLRNRGLPLIIARLVLLACAVGYVVWAVLLLTGIADSGAELIGGGGDGEDSGVGGAVGNSSDPDFARLVVDAAAVRFALAAGLLWGALRPAAGPGLLPVFIALWGFTAGFATRDVVLGLMDGEVDVAQILGLLLHLAACAALVSVWLARHHAVAPLRQSLRMLSARPVGYSPGDVERHSSWRPGDRSDPTDLPDRPD